eukprot:CAMPEP_0181040006 /NCGR_PEP_ID=MMETSP1070-20121207/10807_1 /TAXON_ID=265543 /ORGANISM="Minutocellus polymorphus, Strain NH13" /LENGTH=805 /DNA_ID=CAMNT_0023117965 /DNA_START=601 /DNA_END=3015 /DNA_ORIENTATION=-
MSSSSLPITSGDEHLSTGTRRNNKKASAILAVASTALLGAAATIGYNQYYASNISNNARPFPSSGKLIFAPDGRRGSQLHQLIEKRSLQRFGDDGEEPVTTSSVMTEEPVIHNVEDTYRYTPIVSARSSLPVGELLDDEDTNTMVDIFPVATNEFDEVVESVLMDESENTVTVDSNAVARRRNAVAAKQVVFAFDEQVVISFMNALDVEAGDWIAIAPASVDLGDHGMLGGDDYMAYAYVCDPGTDPVECPRFGSVAWEPQFLSPGEYVAYLAKEDCPEPYTVKATTSTPFTIGTEPANRVEIIEAVPPSPVPVVPTPVPPTPIPVVPTPAPPTASQEVSETPPPPTPSPMGSLDTLWNGGIRNNGIMFEVEAKRDIRITGIDIHTPLKELIPITVYTSGTLIGKEQDASQWTKILTSNVMGAGDHKPTPISVSTMIRAGQKKSFYIDTPSVFIPGPIRYSPSNIPTGSVYAEDDSIGILVGTGNDPFFGVSYPNRIFNGAVHYEELPSRVSPAESSRNNFAASPGTSGPTPIPTPGPTPSPTTGPTSGPVSPSLNNFWWVEPRSHVDKVTLADGVQYEILEVMPHDRNSFTQGLTFNTDNGMLYESIGLYGKSKIRQLDPKTGAVIKSVNMNSRYFAEGMTYIGEDKLMQITWKAKTGFIYNATTLQTISSFSFTTTVNQGWGITFDPRDRTLIVSDGSEYLHFWDPNNPGVDTKPRLKVIRQNPNHSAKRLNELEYVNGKVIANVWFQDVLLVINPETGQCEDEYNLSALWPKNARDREGANVLNGVSVSGEDGVLFVTGKLW